jgi:hypothetical protein
VRATGVYRVAAVLLLLFAVAHTFGFRQSDPAWGVDTLLGLMSVVAIRRAGLHRSYWDLFLAAGFSVGVFYVFSAVLAWQLARLPAGTLADMRVTAWGLRSLLCRHHPRELPLPLRVPDRLLGPGHGVPERGGVALGQEGLSGRRQVRRRATAERSVSALFWRACRSAGDRSGVSLRTTPVRPTTLGKDRVTPWSGFHDPIGMTAFSSRTIISAIRAETTPTPRALAPLPSMMVMFANRTSDSSSLRASSVSRGSPRGTPPTRAPDQTKTSDVAVLPEDLRVHVGRIDVQPPGDVEPEAQAVQVGAGADDALVPEHADEGPRADRVDR